MPHLQPMHPALPQPACTVLLLTNVQLRSSWRRPQRLLTTHDKDSLLVFETTLLQETSMQVQCFEAQTQSRDMQALNQITAANLSKSSSESPDCISPYQWVPHSSSCPALCSVLKLRAVLRYGMGAV